MRVANQRRKDERYGENEVAGRATAGEHLLLSMISRSICMSYNIQATRQYDKDVKLAKKRGLDVNKLVEMKAEEIKLITLVRTGTHSDLF